MFFVYCADKPDHAHVRAANRPAHLEYLGAYADKILAGGPTLTENGEGMNGSVFMIDLPDRAAVEAFLAEEPYAKAGLFESVIVRPWKKVLPK
jgi:uncharacterized protein YciI